MLIPLQSPGSNRCVYNGSRHVLQSLLITNHVRQRTRRWRCIGTFGGRSLSLGF
jgi:hypothetical protein